MHMYEQICRPTDVFFAPPLLGTLVRKRYLHTQWHVIRSHIQSSCMPPHYNHWQHLPGVGLAQAAAWCEPRQRLPDSSPCRRCSTQAWSEPGHSICGFLVFQVFMRMQWEEI